jgi:hypothetical protein
MLKEVRLAATVFSSILLFSCASSKVTQNDIPANSIPQEFGNNKQILLIEKRTRGISKGTMNRGYEKTFTKYYTGKFELASREEIETSSKYKNKEIYRYVLRDYTQTGGTTTLNGINGPGYSYQHSYNLTFHLYDRLNNKDFETIGSGSTPLKAASFTAKALDLKLTK